MVNILVYGAGNVGLANALMLSSHHNVHIYDVDKIRLSHIQENDFSILNEKDIDKLPIVFDNVFIWDWNQSIDFEFIIIALPTNLNSRGKLETESIYRCIGRLKKAYQDAIYIVKSTLPLGGSAVLTELIGDFLYIPEFLREGTTVYDSFYPSRIVIGGNQDRALKAKAVFCECSLNNPEVMLTSHKEAECIKLFSNTYLSMRIAFFNELDLYAMKENLNSETIFRGIGLDERIGLYYNNPSFGFGGYCLPKDTEDVINSIDSVLIKQINHSNQFRMNGIVEHIMDKGCTKIGVYKLSSKSGSNGVRNSSTILIINELVKRGIEVRVYDPNNSRIEALHYVESIEQLFETSQMVIANRIDHDVRQYQDKIFTRDLFNRN